MNDPTHTHVVTLDDNQMHTLRLALADAAELRTESQGAVADSRTCRVV
jgi:hypothetical protein